MLRCSCLQHRDQIDCGKRQGPVQHGIRTPIMPSGGTAMFQGTGERVAKELTAFVSSTMNGMDWNIHLVFFQHISARPDVYLFLPCRRTLSSRRRDRCSAV